MISFDILKYSYINDEVFFCFDFNEDLMAVEKLCESIFKFVVDIDTLKELLKYKI
ncbi:unnamed protein product [Penicillium salamii]|uniref:Uncharacterized protein n=1 Tax=Penicillium salamii TaxID=1612424 RepID=A0A9W4IX93_9EURO|nr:unnamed protein product [Penicillium salamii]CAG8016893.1 unnamed protein product [Penicillium salamii]CAG8248586.1 unnamed protein product [Penicillium salamii]CAG8350701.1 unnamed protein product [Penicillium salamii]CAG8358780.1 unnamed protein product [Penicillium salamii]